MRIALIAGEASGDQLGAPLIAALRERLGPVEFAGIGGPKMISQGMQSWFAMEQLSVMGLVEVLKHLPALLRLRRALVARLLQWRPDVLIGIDAPDFNLSVEKQLKAAGVRTVHYVSPSVWAWRAQRAAKIGASADRVLCLFPMEPPIYAQYGVSARFVGHPAAERFPLETDRPAARRALGLDPTRPLLAVLPGSRGGEISRLAPSFIETTRLFLARHPKFQAIAPMANANCRAAFERALGGRARIQLIDGKADLVLQAAELALLASGTAALESFLAKCPMVVAYRIAPLTHWIVTTFGLLKSNRVSLPNVLSAPDTVPEVLQNAVRPEILLEELEGWLSTPARGSEFAARARKVHLQLRANASSQAADAIVEMLQ
jgi:lipid-A-disaccharide synthase